MLKELVASGDGSLSTMRVAVLLVTAAVLFNWCYLTVKTGTAQPLNWQEVSMIVGALAAKSVQRAFEPKGDQDPPAGPPAGPKV
jgi:hypothetical protein